MKPSNFSQSRILVTGAAGFIGYHVAQRFLQEGAEVLGIDNFNSYYDPALKEERVARLATNTRFQLERLDIADATELERVWAGFKPSIVLHLAAQAGVRYSIENPGAYVSSNVVGTANVLEAARRTTPSHLLIASTSSVYGAAERLPYAESDPIGRPLTLYAATKGATELMGHCYAHLFQIPTTYFRFFTVYGPWGRPDMAPMLFADAMLSGRPINVFNHGEMSRDFTYIDDLVEAIARLTVVTPTMGAAVENDTLSPVAPFRIVNIGPGQPVMLGAFIDTLERALGVKAQRRYLPRQPGDPLATEASNQLLRALTGYAPSTPLATGVERFAEWMLESRHRNPSQIALSSAL